MFCTRICSGLFLGLLLVVGPASCDSADIGFGVSAVTNPDALPGAIFTTLEDGSRVNKNIYESKLDVYLDGGPGPNAPVFAAGLPEGDYFFQVTDPSGKDLLSTDHISCRRFHVNAAGVIDLVYAGTNYVRHRGDWVAEPCQHETGIDQDHAEDGAITVQLMPYDDTPNKGGVYKAWATPVDKYAGDPDFVPTRPNHAVNGEGWAPGDFHGFVPRHSKTDNYKARHRGKPYVPPVLIVEKFHDANLNGVHDLAEEFVSGWLVVVTDPLGGSNHYFTAAEVTAGEGTWFVVEDRPAGTVQTASYLDGALLSSYPYADALVEVNFSGDSGERHAVLYGNAGLGNITACKGYDRDGDGVITSEPTVPGWQFELTGVTVRGDPFGPIYATADESGCALFGDLTPGTYTVTELIPSSGGWVATGPTSHEVVIESQLGAGGIHGTSTEVWFTNRCLGTADFGTKGYWHNKNGLTELEDSAIDFANSLAPYVAESSYFDAGDEPFDGLFSDGTAVAAAHGITGELIAPAGTARAEISHFLVDPNAGGDPREQLAQQLLAYTFNVLHRLDGLGAIIVLPDGSDATAGDLIDLAVDAWSNGTAAEQTAAAQLLDALNNEDDLPFVYQEPCAVEYP